MKTAFNPKRLLLEVLCIFALSETCVMLILPAIAPYLGTVQTGMLDTGMMLMLAAPVVYWRFITAVRGASTAQVPAHMGFGKTTSAVALAAATQLLGLALTAGGIWWQTDNLRTQSQARFEAGSDRTEAEIVQRLNRSLYGLRGARGALAANAHLKRDNFRAYVESRDLPNEFPGIRGFGLIRRVMRPDLNAYTAAQRADGVPDYTVKTNGNNADLYVVEDIEPLQSNRAALGFDLGQDPRRRAALEYAVATGEPTLLAKIELLQDTKKSPGFIYFLPVYKEGTHPQTSTERMRDLLCLVYTPIVVHELFAGVNNITDGQIDFELFDGPEVLPDMAVMDADGTLSVTPTGGLTPEAQTRRHIADRYLNVGSRTMTLRTSTTPRFNAAQDETGLVLIAVGGLLVSLLLTTAVWLLAAGRQRAQEIAQAMTLELRQMAQVIEHTASAVTIMDKQRKIVWANAGFTEITGYTLQEAVGKTPSELLTSEQSDPATVQALIDAADKGESCRVQLVKRAKDGHHYWADIEIQPTFNAQQQLIGFMKISTDISAQKRAQHALESALRDARALLNTIHTHAIVSTADRFGKIIEVNDAFCRISGYTREELIGQDHRIVNSGAHSSAFWSDFWDTVASGKPWRGEICNRAKDGSLYWVDSMVAPYVDSNGLVEKYVSIRSDITSRRQAEEQLRRSEATFVASFENAASGIAFLSPKGQWQRANPAMCEFLGYTEAELQELTFRELTHPDEWEMDNLQVQRLLRGDIPVYQRTKRYLHRDGQVIWGMASISCVREADGSPQFVIAQIVDMTGRKRAEEALNLSNTLMEESQLVAKVGGWKFNMETGHVYWTQETYRIYETTPDEYTPNLVNALTAFLPESGARLQAALQAAMEHGTGYDMELEMMTLQGNRIDVRATGKATYAGGKVVRLSGILQDITERKQHERALDDARQKAEAATVSKGQFLANMSHEIRTPMNSIIGMTRMVLDTELSALQRDYLQKAHNSANSLLRILNDILDFSKLNAGQLQLESIPFHLTASLANVVSLFELSLQKKSLGWKLWVAPDVPTRLLGDALRLEQVLINLIGNAIKFTTEGGIELGIEVVQSSPTDVRLQFSVKDSGIGMDAQQISQLFAPFSQADSSITRKYGGTGLGLSITKELVEMMGGTISAQSVPGQGSRFTFTMRFALDPHQRQDAASAPGSALALAAPDTAPAKPGTQASPGSQASALQEVDWAAATPLILELKQLLFIRNLRARKVAEALGDQLVHTIAAGPYQAVLEQVRQLDFDAALHALNDLQQQEVFPS